MTGVEATPLVLEAAPHTSVLMLTIATDDAGVLDAIRAGACGYLLKDAELTEIAAGIRAAAAGHCPIAPRIASARLEVVRTIDSGPAEAQAPDGPELSVREQQVLSLLSDGCDNAEIASRLYLSRSTVTNYVSKLIDKLEIDNRVQAATFAIRNGYAGAD
jgi:DNA-binding NarL/FixJ family response regulator